MMPHMILDPVAKNVNYDICSRITKYVKPFKQ